MLDKYLMLDGIYQHAEDFPEIKFLSSKCQKASWKWGNNLDLLGRVRLEQQKSKEQQPGQHVIKWLLLHGVCLQYIHWREEMWVVEMK